MKDISIYIHIPFCISKCNYCDFISFPGQLNKVEDYINSLIKELSLYRERLKDRRIRTIFIGGGTPSAIDGRYILKILNYIYDNFNTYEDMEISIELNPKTFDLEKLKIYKEAKINRISIGLQTLNDPILRQLGRIHNADDFFESYQMLLSSGFENINVDLMFNLPDQTVEDGMKDVMTLAQLGVKHISYYSLIIESGTVMDRWHRENKLNLLDEDSERKLYHDVRAYLEEKGYNHYEISNFALKGYECKHNMIYWKIKEYLGVGLSSHSYLDGKRFWNTKNIKAYIQCLNEGNLPIEDDEAISKEIEMAEYCIFGLRMIKGIDKGEFKNRFNVSIDHVYRDSIDKHIDSGLLFEDEKYIRLTHRGLDLANIVEVDFLP